MGADQLSQCPFVGKDLDALAPPLNVGVRFRAHWKGAAHLTCAHDADPSILGLLSILSSPSLLLEGNHQTRLGFLQPLSWDTEIRQL